MVWGWGLTSLTLASVPTTMVSPKMALFNGIPQQVSPKLHYHGLFG